MAKTTIPVELSSTPSIVDNGNATAITIDSSENSTFSGNINLDLATPSVIFKESGAAKFFIGESSAVGGGSGYYDLYAAGGLGQRFFTGAAERMRIDSSGNVGIGTSSPNAYSNVTTLTVNGTVQGRLDCEYGGTLGGSFLAVSGETQVKAVGSSNVMTFEVNDAERMRIDTSGRVGIGTSAPETFLHVKTTSPTISMTDTNSFADTNDRFQIRANADVGQFQWYDNSASSTSTLMEIHPSGQVLVKPLGVSTPSFAFIGDSNTGITRPTGDTLQFVCGGSEKMRITSNGRLLIGGTADRGGNIVVGGDSNTARVLPMTDNVGYVGDSTFRWQAIYANNSSIQTSDEREKTQIKETTLGLDFIKDLKPISYKWIDAEQCNKGKDEREHQGLIAQQVAKTVEKHGIDKNTFGGLDIQKTEKYNDFHGMSYSEFIAPLIKAIQELEARITELEDG